MKLEFMSWPRAFVLGLALFVPQLATAQTQNTRCLPYTTPSQKTLCAKRCLVTPNTKTAAPSNTAQNYNIYEETPCKPASGQTMLAHQRTVEVAIWSVALGRRVGVRVVLPKNFYATNHAPSPVLYLLHGTDTSGPASAEYNYNLWTDRTDMEDTTYDTDALIVMPEGGDVGWYSDWSTQPPGFKQNWETFFFSELMPLIETAFDASGRRAIAGLSMGGFGAVSYAARHKSPSQSFVAAASFSGMLSTREFYAVPTSSLSIKGFAGSWLWGSSNSTVWSSHDPRQLVDTLVNTPIWVHSGSGYGDNGSYDLLEAGAWAASTSFSNAFQSALHRAATATPSTPPKGSLVTDFYCNGLHSWPYWQLELKRAWPFLAAHLLNKPQCAPKFPAECGQAPPPFSCP